jgi:hypothetical protein
MTVLEITKIVMRPAEAPWDAGKNIERNDCKKNNGAVIAIDGMIQINERSSRICGHSSLEKSSGNGAVAGDAKARPMRSVIAHDTPKHQNNVFSILIFMFILKDEGERV